MPLCKTPRKEVETNAIPFLKRPKVVDGVRSQMMNWISCLVCPSRSDINGSTFSRRDVRVYIVWFRLLHLNEYLVDTRVGYLVCSFYWQIKSIIMSGVRFNKGRYYLYLFHNRT